MMRRQFFSPEGEAFCADLALVSAGVMRAMRTSRLRQLMASSCLVVREFETPSEPDLALRWQKLEWFHTSRRFPDLGEYDSYLNL